jgi:hypothetical protein
MLQTGLVRALAWCRPIGLAVVVLVAGTAPAVAQYSPPASPAVGEDYHFEIAYSFWNADPSLLVSSESLGIPGTDIDLVQDLGIESEQMRRLNIVLRPAQKHKFRFEYTPVTYETESFPVQREFVFNGQRYRVGLPVSTTAEFKTFRFGYEYDFISRNRGYLGVLLDLKYTDVSVTLLSPIGEEFTTQAAPIPTIGLTGRGYVAPNVAIGGEVSFFRVPDNLSETYDGSYTDYDFYGLVNFNRNVGAQVGYRSIDIFYEADFDHGALKFKGWYFGGTLRF